MTEESVTAYDFRKGMVLAASIVAGVIAYKLIRNVAYTIALKARRNKTK